MCMWERESLWGCEHMRQMPEVFVRGAGPGVIGSCEPTHMFLRCELGCSARAVLSLKGWALSPVPSILTFLTLYLHQYKTIFYSLGYDPKVSLFILFSRYSSLSSSVCHPVIILTVMLSYVHYINFSIYNVFVEFSLLFLLYFWRTWWHCVALTDMSHTILRPESINIQHF